MAVFCKEKDCTANLYGALLSTTVEDEVLWVLHSVKMIYFHCQTGIFGAINVYLCSFTYFMCYTRGLLHELDVSGNFPKN